MEAGASGEWVWNGWVSGRCEWNSGLHEIGSEVRVWEGQEAFVVCLMETRNGRDGVEHGV